MNFRILLDSFSDMLFLIQDENKNIIYPIVEDKINYIEKLIICDNECFHPNTKKWYQKDDFVFTSDGKKYCVTRFLDVTKHKDLENDFMIDETTGLFLKKKAFLEFNKYIKKAKINQESFAIVMADIDYFKKVNDVYGHFIGDMVLKDVGKTLLNHFRSKEDDLLGRIGGEEFLIVLKNIRKQVALKRIEQLREYIEKKTISCQGHKISITCSFGITYVNQARLKSISLEHEQIEVFRNILLQEADEQLYLAKNSGRNKVKIKN